MKRGTVFRCEPDASHTTHIDSVTFGHQTHTKKKGKRSRGERNLKERKERMEKNSVMDMNERKGETTKNTNTRVPLGTQFLLASENNGFIGRLAAENRLFD